MSTEVRKFLRGLTKQGFSIEKTRSGHYKLNHSNLNKTVFLPGTPSDYRSLKNVQSEIKRHMAA